MCVVGVGVIGGVRVRRVVRDVGVVRDGGDYFLGFFYYFDVWLGIDD